MKFRCGILLLCLCFIAQAGFRAAATDPGTPSPTPGDGMFASYFKEQVDAISESWMADVRPQADWESRHPLLRRQASDMPALDPMFGTFMADIRSQADWESRRPVLRRQAAEMLGHDPMPERTPLNPVITGKLERDDFTVEKLCFQSQPHLYVTANLYLPKSLSSPAPAVLYLCGHTPVITNDVSFGNKTAYQHHGIWFARNGYVCLVVDSLQWGEIGGHHRGTYADGMWWWNARGYTPAGVETWNAIRALDYLASRPEVDAARIGLTGRSGGGAYSWFVAAVDERVKVVAPVAGITDLRNYVVDGTVDHHCDCMFFVNTYRWDYPVLAALCAPRPLLLENSDADRLFPLDGVIRTRDCVKRIYDLCGASTNLGLVIAPGPHEDTQDLQVPVFRWFNHHLKHVDPPIEMAAVKMFAPQELKVLDSIPADQINTKIEDSFVPAAQPPAVPATAQAWEELRQKWMLGLREKCFAGWPADSGTPPLQPLFAVESGGIRSEAYVLQSQPEATLWLGLIRKAGHHKPVNLLIHVADSSFTSSAPDLGAEAAPTVLQFKNMLGASEATDRLIDDVRQNGAAHAIFLPRGIGPTACSGGVKGLTQLRRRFMLLGQTLDGMRVWDICTTVRALHSTREYRGTRIVLQASGTMAVNALYASLFEPGIAELRLSHVPSSHMQGPDYLNVLKVLDIPQAAAMAAQRCQVELQSDDTQGWQFLHDMADCPAAKLKLRFAQ
jgi:dienelactone hydrolase